MSPLAAGQTGEEGAAVIDHKNIQGSLPTPAKQITRPSAFTRNCRGLTRQVIQVPTLYLLFTFS